MINAETEALGGFVGDALAVPALPGRHAAHQPALHVHAGLEAGPRRGRALPAADVAHPEAAAAGQPLGKRARAPGAPQRRADQRDGGGRARHPRQRRRAATSAPASASSWAQVFWIRFDIYKKKFLIKFLNNFIAQLGPFFFFSIGGYLVIQGQITLGALVAVVGAQKDMASPWRSC